MKDLTENFSLKAMNTFGIDAKANFFASFGNIEELKSLIADNRDKKLLILGGGSNVLFTQDFEGLVLKNEIQKIQKLKEDEEHIWLKVGAGEVWHSFVLHCVNQQYGGVENLSLIPGTVGAAPMQNIGAYGVEVKDVIEKVEALDLTSLTLTTFTKEECKFGYRESIFKHTHKNQFVITHVIFKLHKRHRLNTSYGAITKTLEEMNILTPTIKTVSEAVIHIRQSKLPDPKQIGNAGSFFKNPELERETFELLKQKFPDVIFYPLDNGKVKIPAGWLIDKAGWKGKRFGEIGVHDKQALVLVNYGNGNGADIKELSEKILAHVKEVYGIELHREVNLV